MSWQAYRLLFRVLSPIHIGFERIGNLQRTRPYVLGRNLWAAAAANLVLDGSANSHEEARSELSRDYRFGYLFPTFPGDTVYAPLYRKDGLFFGREDRVVGLREFEYCFLGSTAHTGLSLVNRGAEEGSLHEVECLLSRARPEATPTYLSGMLFARQTVGIAAIRQLLHDLQIGGERTYGLGRIRLESIETANGDSLQGFEVRQTDDSPIAVGQGPIPAHWIINERQTDSLTVVGEVEMLVGRDTRDTGHGAVLIPAIACWCPGSLVDTRRSFRVLAQGLWEQVA